MSYLYVVLIALGVNVATLGGLAVELRRALRKQFGAMFGPMFGGVGVPTTSATLSSAVKPRSDNAPL